MSPSEGQRWQRLDTYLRAIATPDDSANFHRDLLLEAVLQRLPARLRLVYSLHRTEEYNLAKFGKDLAECGWTTARGPWSCPRRWVKLRYEPTPDPAHPQSRVGEMLLSESVCQRPPDCESRSRDEIHRLDCFDMPSHSLLVDSDTLTVEKEQRSIDLVLGPSRDPFRPALPMDIPPEIVAFPDTVDAATVMATASVALAAANHASNLSDVELSLLSSFLRQGVPTSAADGTAELRRQVSELKAQLADAKAQLELAHRKPDEPGDRYTHNWSDSVGYAMRYDDEFSMTASREEPLNWHGDESVDSVRNSKSHWGEARSGQVVSAATEGKSKRISLLHEDDIFSEEASFAFEANQDPHLAADTPVSKYVDNQMRPPPMPCFKAARHG